MNRQKFILVVENVHMGLGHEGLCLLAKQKFRVDATNLADDHLLMFMNRAKDKLKIMGGKGKVVGYLRMPKGRRIMMEAIQFIPQTFGAQGFNYEEALKRALEQKLGITSQRTRVGPLAAYRAMERSGLTARTTT